MGELGEYRRKRDPARTPEPFGAGGRGEDGRPRFVVQRHSARRLHYDLRLERDGVLASWAVPKGFPTEPGSRRMAVHTEDHPLEYLTWEGEIPAGEYGGGTMDVYDSGPYEFLEEKRNGQLTVRLDGDRLRGTWTLVPAHLDGEERNWLLVKREEGSRPTNRRRYRPMLPAPARRLPRGDWLHEAEWGGERTLARLAEGEPELWNAAGAETTDTHPMIARALGRGLRTFDCVVDGEIVGRGGSEVYVVRDVLQLEGEELLGRALGERRAVLEELVDPRTAPIRLSESFPDGRALLEAAEEQGLAGVLARDPESPYLPGDRDDRWRLVSVRPPRDAGEAEDDERVIRAGRRTVRIRHPEQRWWPDEALTKADTIEYYRGVAPVLLPHLHARPFTIKQHYNGPRSPFRWLKDLPPEAPDWIPVTEQPAKSRGGAPVRYPLVNDEATLVWMVDYGCVDLHVWLSRADKPDRPDAVLFDLDPADVPFSDVVRAAHLLRAALDALGLDAYVRTTGGEGLHVLVPVARVHDHAEARAFAEVVAGALAATSDGLVTTERTTSGRRGVFVDTKMNGHGQQVAAAYSVRPLPGAPVATPLRWDELVEDLDPRELTMAVVRERVDRLGDLHEPVLHGRQRLKAALDRLV
jgi:bifunctional non-homologous end joining protein LigD